MTSRLREPPKEAGQRIRAQPSLSISPQQMRPKFCLEHLRKSHCLSNCTKDEKAALADRLHELSQLTWQQIVQAPKKGQGHEIISRNAIGKDVIPALITEDTNIIAFRFFGKAPMVGFRDAEVFHIVWIDRAFDLYDHGP